MSGISQRTSIYLICLSAISTALAFPPYKLGFLAYVTPVLLLAVLENVSIRKAFIYGYIWGLVFNTGVLYGVFWATIPGSFGMLAIMSLLPAMFCVAYLFISRQSAMMGYIFWPMFWVGWDYLRTLTELNFPWTDYGYTQSYYLPLIQASEIFGVFGVSFMIHTVNILLFIALKKYFLGQRLRYQIIAAIVLPLLFLIYGWTRLPELPVEGDLKIALAQGNITREIKWRDGGDEFSLNRYLDMTRQADSLGADLCVWPETAAPFYLLHERKRLQSVKDVVNENTIHLLTGVPHYERVGIREYIYFNSAIMISPAVDTIAIYEKLRLVPISERIPFSGRYKILKEIRLGQADFSSGRKMTVFSINGTKFGSVICFESAFPYLCADFCRMGAEFLVVITNDMWFGPSSMAHQHARMSVFRAIENRVPLVRCANTGISMFIDKYGRVADQTSMYEQDLVVDTIKPERSNSIYNSIGDVLPQVCVIGSFLIIAFAFFKQRKYND